MTRRALLPWKLPCPEIPIQRVEPRQGACFYKGRAINEMPAIRGEKILGPNSRLLAGGPGAQPLALSQGSKVLPSQVKKSSHLVGNRVHRDEQGPGSRGQGPGIRGQGAGARGQGSGAREQGSGKNVLLAARALAQRVGPRCETRSRRRGQGSAAFARATARNGGSGIGLRSPDSCLLPPCALCLTPCALSL
jgi:hypothetical protein